MATFTGPLDVGSVTRSPRQRRNCRANVSDTTTWSACTASFSTDAESPSMKRYRLCAACNNKSREITATGMP